MVHTRFLGTERDANSRLGSPDTQCAAALRIMVLFLI